MSDSKAPSGGAEVDEQMNKELLASCLRRVRMIVDSNAIVAHANEPYPGFWASAYTEAVINLDHVLQALHRMGHRIDFKDDVLAVGSKQWDVTDLINFQRNAACHNSSPSHVRKDGGTLSFCVDRVKGSDWRIIFGDPTCTMKGICFAL